MGYAPAHAIGQLNAKSKHLLFQGVTTTKKQKRIPRFLLALLRFCGHLRRWPPKWRNSSKSAKVANIWDGGHLRLQLAAFRKRPDPPAIMRGLRCLDAEGILGPAHRPPGQAGGLGLRLDPTYRQWAVGQRRAQEVLGLVLYRSAGVSCEVFSA